jgi:hypothetical protein
LQHLKWLCPRQRRFLGFPEKAAEFAGDARNRMTYADKMAAGDISLTGRDNIGFQVPPETGRLYEAARIEGRATSDAPESVEGPDGYLPASIIQSRRMPTPSGVSADFQMDLMSPSLGNPRNIPSRNEIDIPLPEGSLQPSMSPGGLFMAPAGLSPADKTDRMRLKQNPATMMFAPDGSVIRNQGDLVDPIAEMERAVRAQRADGALTQGGMDSENQIDIFDQTPDELTALKLQSEMNKNPELNSIKVQDSLKAQGARRKIYVPEDPSLFDLETLTRYPGALLNLGSKGIDYLLKSQIGLDENNTPFISGPTKESSLFGKEYPGQESYQKVLDAASTDATANDINDSIFSAGKWAGEKTLDAANSIASSIKNLPEFMTGEGSGGYRGLAENLQKNRPELFTNPELIKPETNDVPPAVTTTTVPPAVTTTTTTVPDRAANKTREDKLKTMGIQMSIDDIAADRSFTNQKALLNIRAGMDLKGNIISQFNSSKEVGMDALTASPLSTLKLPELDMEATKYAWKGVLQTYGLEGLKSAGLYESNKTMLDILQKDIDEEKYMP